MCINPAKLPNGQTFGCRQCWQCIENKIQDWVGRCIAESKTSTKTFSVTLTYGGGDHERATVLTYSDVQKYFKRLRKAGYKFKYLIAGEYGSLKGRAHWHAVMFFDGKFPEVELNKTYHGHKEWPHGHTMWKDPEPSHVRYVCKYIQKDVLDDERQGHFMMSKKPPIGSEYFAQMAQKFVDDGLAPQHLRYSFPDNRGKDGKPVQHMMHDTTARQFLWEYCYRWGTQRPEEDIPNSDLVEEFIDTLNSYAVDPYMEKRAQAVRPWFLPAEGCELRMHERTRRYITHISGAGWTWLPLDPREPRREHAWHADDGSRVIRWEQSDRYKTLVRRSEARKAALEEQATLRRGETPVPQYDYRPAGRRLPMVGDPSLPPPPRKSR